MNEPTSERSLHLVAGVVTALAVIGLCGGGGYLFAERRMSQLKRGWVLKAVALGARDVRAGTVLSANDLVVGEVPEQLVTGHAVLGPEGSTLVGKTLLAPLSSGELVDRGHVELVPIAQPSVDAACAEAANATARSLGLEGDVSVTAFVKQLEARSSK